MICKNCGFHNAEGDEFCGSCGQFLEWTGVKAEDTQPAPAADADTTAPEPPPPPATAEQTMAMPVPPPRAAPPPPAGPPPPPPPPTGTPANPQFSGRGPDIICWNCGRRNPGGRTFCIQCGERLTAGKPASAVKAAGVVGGAAVIAPPPSGGGGGNRRTIAIAVGLILVLIIAALGAAAFLGNNPPATPTQIALASPTATVSSAPSATSLVTPTPSLLTPTPTLAPTLGPTIPPTATPTVKPTAKPTAKPTVKPTAPPPNAVCTNSTKSTFSTSFLSNNAIKVLDSHTAWCVHKVVFTAGSGVGLLKLYLINNAFEVSPYGWLEARMPNDFGAGSTFTADLNSIALPNGYDNIPPGTTVKFKITCQGGPCSGSVKISYQPISIP